MRRRYLLYESRLALRGATFNLLAMKSWVSVPLFVLVVTSVYANEGLRRVEFLEPRDAPLETITFEDFDQDGFLDFCGASVRYSATIFYGTSDSRVYDEVLMEGGINYTVFAQAVDDLDGDGRSEIVVGGPDAQPLQVYWNLGGRQFKQQLLSGGNSALGIEIVDFDADSDLDLVVCERVDNQLVVYLQEQGSDGGAFERVFERQLLGSFLEPYATRTLQMDDDAALEILLTTSEGLRVLDYRTTPFRPEGEWWPGNAVVGTGYRGGRFLLHDVNADGLDEVLVCSQSRPVLYGYEQTADGSLREKVLFESDGAPFRNVVVGDIDGNTISDVIVMSRLTEINVLMNVGSDDDVVLQVKGRDPEAVPNRNPTFPFADDVAVADIDGDGRGEIVPASEAAAFVYYKWTPSVPNELGIHLHVDRPNERDRFPRVDLHWEGVGGPAELEASRDLRTWFRWLGYDSSSPSAKVLPQEKQLFFRLAKELE